jgi:hypothetical protein
LQGLKTLFPITDNAISDLQSNLPVSENTAIQRDRGTQMPRKSPTFLLCSIHDPNQIGNGGAHRLSQLLELLIEAFPTSNVHHVCWGKLPRSPIVDNNLIPPRRFWRRALDRLFKSRFRPRVVLANPRNIIGRKWFDFWDDEQRNTKYEEILLTSLKNGTVISVLQGAAFGRALDINKKH